MMIGHHHREASEDGSVHIRFDLLVKTSYKDKATKTDYDAVERFLLTPAPEGAYIDHAAVNQREGKPGESFFTSKIFSDKELTS